MRPLLVQVVPRCGIAVRHGVVVVRVDPRYFRPTEVETLLGDASKAQEKLGWKAKTSFEELVKEMTLSDFHEAELSIRSACSE